MLPQVLFQNRKPDRIITLDEYRAMGGYGALTQALRKMSPRLSPIPDCEAAEAPVFRRD
jgi:NADH:ubiquinone oxidoreductase subunit F (NADH-binding)